MNRVNIPYLVTGVALLALAALVGQQALAMSFYSFLGPGAGFFPAILSVILFVLVAALMYQAVARPGDLPQAPFTGASGAGFARIFAVVGGLFAIAYLIERIGFPVALTAFFFVLFALLGKKNVIFSLALAVTLSAAYYLFFKELLRVPLPSGILGL